MTLSAGSRLGPYEIVTAVGAGGMGEVFRARDTKLNRVVALKVLPDSFASNPDRLARFTREAQTLASLNHPNIAAIYGLESQGDDATRCIVMELVEGEDLSQRISRGAIPLDEAIPIAKQIADALEAAHEQGIVHRDLKPANIKVRADGTVKVLDFGLAKAMVGDESQTELTRDLSPTTQPGMILGTAPYMAPEQARGRTVDRRVDIWSFGVVLFEMLTGAPLFHGDTISDTVAAVLTRELDWSTLPRATPASVRQLLKRCLERDPRRRLQAIGEARVVIEALQDPGADSIHPTGAQPIRPKWRTAATVATLAVLMFVGGWLARPAPAGRSTVRKVDLSVNDLDANISRVPVIAPDGSRVAFVAGGRLRIRRFDSLDAVAIPDSDGAAYISWATDSRSPSGFGRFRRMAAPRETVPLDRQNETDFHELGLLPAGKGVLTILHRRSHPADAIAVLDDGGRHVVLEVPDQNLRSPIYSPTGHILYERQTTSPGIWAVPFSLERLATTGAPILVVPGGSMPSLSADGTLCFVRTDDALVDLVRVTRLGVAERVAELPETNAYVVAPVESGGGYRPMAGVSLSPDGRQVAVNAGSPGRMMIYELERGALSVVAIGTFGMPAVWSARGERLAYSSTREARAWNVWWRRADGGGDEQRLMTSDNIQLPLALSRDGTSIVFAEGSGQMGSLQRAPADGNGPATPLFKNSWGLGASFSPDGRWLAFESFESGRMDVYVRPYPDGEQRIQVSTTGGERPVWRNGELFYLGGGGISVVSVVDHGGSLTISKPALLFPAGGDTRLIPTFDVTPDGQRFLMLRTRGGQHVSLIFDWPADLRNHR